MGQMGSKMVSRAFEESPEFGSACNSEYEHLLALTQHAFPGVLHYQLFPASQRLHLALSSSSTTTHRPHPLISKWVPNPPTRAQVDRAYEAVAVRRRFHQHDDDEEKEEEGAVLLEQAQFKAFAVELFTDAVLDKAGKALFWRLPVGIAGIAGVGVVTRSKKKAVAMAIGVYAFGVATNLYVGLSG